MRDDDTVFSVSEINRLARNTVERQFSGIQLEGEIAELLQHRSGHWYFTLKDDNAQLRVAMFRSSNQRVKFNPEDGQQVLLRGKLSIYEARGSFQFIAESMQPAGVGKLQLAFDRLKQKLAAQGLFSEEYKQPLPTLPRQIAIVTSPQGAAIRDMLSTFKRRFPGVKLVVVPAAVQGDTAAAEIAASIARINQLGTQASFANFEPDAIIIGRGGGSLEDLWAFNEEVVARAIFNSRLPVVSAVGHETDFTIADFVADIRAATPTAAAELLSPDRDALLSQLGATCAQLNNRMRQQLAFHRLSAENISTRLQHPGARIRQQAQQLDHLDMRLFQGFRRHLDQLGQQLTAKDKAISTHSPANKVLAHRITLEHCQHRLHRATEGSFKQLNQQLGQLAESMHLVSPMATIGRGYAIVEKQNGQVVRSTEDVTAGEQLTSRVSDGSILCRVESR